MIQAMPDPCILFALRREAGPFLREFKPRQRIPTAPCWAWHCGPAAHSVLVLQAGVGARRMEQALTWFLDQPEKPTFLLSAGYSGALKDHEVGTLVLATEVVDEAGGMWQSDWPGARAGDCPPPLQRGRILCVSRLVTDAAEKRQLGQRYDALAVDMETAVIARRCAEAGVPFGCLRIISDPVEQTLAPDLAGLLSGPRVSLWAVVKLLLGSPRLAGELVRLERQTRLASRRLSQGLVCLLTEAAGNGSETFHT